MSTAAVINSETTTPEISRDISEAVSLYEQWRNPWDLIHEQSLNTKLFVVDSKSQWSDADKSVLDARKQFHIAINKLLPIFLQMLGIKDQNKSEFRPISETGDYDGAERMHWMMKYAMENQNDYYDVENACFGDGLMMRSAGWMRIYYGYRKGHAQIIYDHVESTSIVLDPSCRKYDLSDARGLFHSEYYAYTQLMEMFPAQSQNIQFMHNRYSNDQSKFMAEFSDTFNSILGGVRASSLVGEHYVDRISGKWRLLYFNYKKVVRKPYAMEKDTGFEHDLSESPQHVIEQLTADSNILMINKPVEEFWVRAIIPGMELVAWEGKQQHQTGHFEFVRFAAYNKSPRLIENVTPFDNMIDVQLEMNKRSSAALDYISKFGHPKWMIKKNSIDHDGKRDLLSPDAATVEYKGDKAPEAEQFNGTTIENIQNFEKLQRDLFDISGITPNDLGRPGTANETASLFRERIQQSSVNMRPILNNLTKSRQIVGYITIAMLQQYYRQPQILNVTSHNNPKGKMIPINLPTVHPGQKVGDMSEGRYNLRLIDTDYNETTKRKNLDLFFSMAQMLPPEFVVANFDLIIKNMDLGGDTDDWIERTQLWQQQAQAQAQAASEQVQNEEDRKNLEVKAKSDTVKVKLLDVLTKMADVGNDRKETVKSINKT